MNPRSLPAIALGGMAGAAARWWVHGVWPYGAESWATLGVNVAGSAVLGWLVAADAARRGAPVAILGAGFCGSFTTCSAFSLIVAEHLDSGGPGAGVLYAAVSLSAAIVAAVAGGCLRRRWCRWRRPVTP